MLVYLFYFLFQTRLEIEADCKAGIVVSPLQIEHFQGMIAFTGKCVFIPSYLVHPARLFKHFFERCFCNQPWVVCRVYRNTIFLSARRAKAPPNTNFTGRKINRAIKLAVRAAQIQHKHIVNKYPYIVVSGKLEGHGLGAACSRFYHAIRRLTKVCCNRHAEVVVHVIAIGQIRIFCRCRTSGTGNLAFKFSIYNPTENLCPFIKREEIPYTVLAICADCCRSIIQSKPSCVLIIFCKIFSHIIIIIPLIIHLE